MMIRPQPKVSRNRRAADLPHPSSETHSVLQNAAFRRIGYQSFKKTFHSRAKHPSNFMPDFPQKLKFEDVETKLFVQDLLQKLEVGGCGGCDSGGCHGGGCDSGGCHGGGCDSGGCESGGCDSGGCDSGGCDSAGCHDGSCDSGGCDSGGCGGSTVGCDRGGSGCLDF